MRNYEVLYIIKPDLEEEKISAVVEKFKKVVVDNGGEVTLLDEWGKRKLAYDIKKYSEGYYVLMKFKSSVETARELERLLKISDDVIRHLLVRLEDEKQAS